LISRAPNKQQPELGAVEDRDALRSWIGLRAWLC
jgi:hypothetical protein